MHPTRFWVVEQRQLRQLRFLGQKSSDSPSEERTGGWGDEFLVSRTLRSLENRNKPLHLACYAAGLQPRGRMLAFVTFDTKRASIPKRLDGAQLRGITNPKFGLSRSHLEQVHRWHCAVRIWLAIRISETSHDGEDGPHACRCFLCRLMAKSSWVIPLCWIQNELKGLLAGRPIVETSCWRGCPGTGLRGVATSPVKPTSMA